MIHFRQSIEYGKLECLFISGKPRSAIYFPCEGTKMCHAKYEKSIYNSVVARIM